METNYYQVVEMTDNEKRKMYKKFPKRELITMLIEANKVIVNMSNSGATQFSFTSDRTGAI